MPPRPCVLSPSAREGILSGAPEAPLGPGLLSESGHSPSGPREKQRPENRNGETPPHCS